MFYVLLNTEFSLKMRFLYHRKIILRDRKQTDFQVVTGKGETGVPDSESPGPGGQGLGLRTSVILTNHG